MRLIDADKVIDVIFKECVEYDLNYDYCSGVMDGLGKAIKIIVVQPTIEPVKCGKWVSDTTGVVKCSACKHQAYFVQGYEYFDYCPFCGVKMVGDD